MRAIKIGFIDIPDRNINSLLQLIESDYRFKLCGVIEDTATGIEFINKEQPDVLFLRYELPSGESVNLLEEIAGLDSEIRPYIIMTSTISNSVLISFLISVGACDFVRRPYDIASIMERLSYLYAYINNNHAGYRVCEYEECFDSRFRVKEADVLVPKQQQTNIVTGVAYDLLINSGIPLGMLGFDYLIECIKILYFEKRDMIFCTQNLYMDVAAIHLKQPSSIEKSIRVAIQGGWKNHQLSESDRYLDLFKRFTTKPSNKEFIKYAVCYVKKILDGGLFSG